MANALFNKLVNLGGKIMLNFYITFTKGFTDLQMTDFFFFFYVSKLVFFICIFLIGFCKIYFCSLSFIYRCLKNKPTDSKRKSKQCVAVP